MKTPQIILMPYRVVFKDERRAANSEQTDHQIMPWFG